MSVALENMIAATEPPCTAPDIAVKTFANARKTKSRPVVRSTFGDPSPIFSALPLATEHLTEALDLQVGDRVFDLAAGNEGVSVAESEVLPYEADSFDAVKSVFSTTFASNHERTARELLRVCRPGGRIGLTSWAPNGFIAELVSTLRRYAARESCVNNRVLWGTKTYLNQLFGDFADALGAKSRFHAWRYQSPRHWLESWRLGRGPVQDIYRSMNPEWHPQLSSDLIEVVEQHNEADDGTMIIHSEYLEFLVHKSTWRM